MTLPFPKETHGPGHSVSCGLGPRLPLPTSGSDPGSRAVTTTTHLMWTPTVPLALPLCRFCSSDSSPCSPLLPPLFFLSTELYAFLPCFQPALSWVPACLLPPQSPTPALNVDTNHLGWKDGVHLLPFVTGEAGLVRPVANPTMSSSVVGSTPARPSGLSVTQGHRSHPRGGQVSHTTPCISVPAPNGASQPVWVPKCTHNS